MVRTPASMSAELARAGETRVVIIALVDAATKPASIAARRDGSDGGVVAASSSSDEDEDEAEARTTTRLARRRPRWDADARAEARSVAAEETEPMASGIAATCGRIAACVVRARVECRRDATETSRHVHRRRRVALARFGSGTRSVGASTDRGETFVRLEVPRQTRRAR